MIIKNITKRAAAAVTAVFIAGTMCLSGCGKKEAVSEADPSGVFNPSLDTQKQVSLNIAGFLGNFEALDQVVNSFNEIYPNVTISYEASGGNNKLVEYLKNNPEVDIFMTTDDNVRNTSNSGIYVGDYCLDLSKENIDFGAIQDNMIESATIDGKMLRLPIAQSTSGMVVNKSLLEKEGLKVPLNYSEFLDVCQALKNKGYTPIQGSKTHVGSDMVINMAMNRIGNDSGLIDAFDSNSETAAEGFRDVLSRCSEIVSCGYTDYELDAQYPDDNYDGAILRFFEGNVPFWICNAESVSGMKKRESKSVAYTENPFEYSFIYVPLGDNGAYEYIEPWYGFSINKNSSVRDYAVEFMRFLATNDQINKIAEIKGMPSVAKVSSDKVYAGIHGIENIAGSYTYKGRVRSNIKNTVCDVSNGIIRGAYTDVDQAVNDLSERCLKK